MHSGVNSMVPIALFQTLGGKRTTSQLTLVYEPLPRIVRLAPRGHSLSPSFSPGASSVRRSARKWATSDQPNPRFNRTVPSVATGKERTFVSGVITGSAAFHRNLRLLGAFEASRRGFFLKSSARIWATGSLSGVWSHRWRCFRKFSSSERALETIYIWCCLRKGTWKTASLSLGGDNLYPACFILPFFYLYLLFSSFFSLFACFVTMFYDARWIWRVYRWMKMFRGGK